jgi:ABC-type antimicrobial peptide transport system permease subunit
MFGLFGAAALALTAIGLYSVMTFVVAQRTREFGIRLALGAAPRDIVRLVMRQGGRQLVTGLTIGIVLATVMTKAFTAAVEVVSVPLAPLLASVAFSIAIASSLALIGPVRQAMGTRPLKW